MAEQTVERTVESADRKEAIGAALGRIPSGVFVVTAKRGASKIGMMGSWIIQAGFTPPCISVAILPEREIYQAIQESGAFCVNILSNENMELMRAFSKYSPDQFDGLDITETPSGIILNGTVAVLQCRLKGICDIADHHLFVGEVIDGEYLDHEQKPMIHLRKSGFNY